MFSQMGLFFATVTAVVNVFTDVSRKKALVRNDLLATTFWIRLIAAAAFTAVFLWHVHTFGPLHFVNDTEPPFGPYVSRLPAIAIFLIYAFADTVLVAITVLLYFRALQLSDLSLSVPFLSFTPVMLVVTGSLFLRETPQPEKLIGIGLVVLGSVLMNRSAFRYGLLGPVKALLREKGSRYMLLVACILGITNPLDKKLVIMSDAFTYAFVYGIMLWLLLTLPALWRRSPLASPVRGALVWLLLAGWLIFREKKIGERLVASAVMLCGVMLIYLPVSMRAALAIAGVVILFVLLGLNWNNRQPAATISEANSE